MFHSYRAVGKAHQSGISTYCPFLTIQSYYTLYRGFRQAYDRVLSIVIYTR